MKPYYLLWGYRKCGTTTLAQTMKQSGVTMPDWDESNIWLARPDSIAGHLEQLWRDSWDAPYLVDLSTLTHLSPVDPADMLRPHGFTPRYIVCSRRVGPRWLSAFAHMRRKQADMRSLKRYLTFYEGFVGLSWSDLRQLEDELIARDLAQGLKSTSGILGADYFRKSHPISFEADPIDPFYQFRYFGETIDMLEKRPQTYVELPLDDPEIGMRWIANTFAVTVVRGTGPAMNRNSLFNALRHNPNMTRVTRHFPRPLRQGVARWIETTRLLPRIGGQRGDPGVELAMARLAEEMLNAPQRAVQEDSDG